jgi:isoleucyl-tRNA synthetase
LKERLGNIKQVDYKSAFNIVTDVKGGKAAFTPVELRRKCKEFALANLKGQEVNFRRLGVWGDWAHPYITLDPKFEAAQLRVFGKMAQAGYLYKGLKPVYWCANCETALAEAEVEYADHTSESIFVKFSMTKESRAKLPVQVPDGQEVSFVIWTTTPWTLPANLGIALHPQFEYHFLQTPNQGILVVADALKETFLSTVGESNGWQNGDVKTIAKVEGAKLERLEGQHPFVERTSLVILGDHVTAEAGTGCVHTAPGHGLEDFEVGGKYKLGVLSPVDNRGFFTEEGGQFAGQRYNKANESIIEVLKTSGKLVFHSRFNHSYPHCWRCKKPVIYRATEQWFASIDGFRKKALEAIDTVAWHPASGRNRIYTMVENRSDWCISRQRSWGVPIPVFYCTSCRKPLLTKDSVDAVAAVVEKEGSDSWWEKDADYFLQGKFKCECGCGSFENETDIMDVWFDSGVTHASVIDLRPELRGTPCELYLEGSDQHRGWFQSSLLTSVAVHNRAPYKTVLTHGFIVDESGRKMSKSLGNMVEPEEVIKQYGADVLRLWVASVNYTDDVPIGKNLLAQLAEVYRKLRNTARYMLGNLNDYDRANAVSYDKLSKLDAYILHKLQEIIAEITEDFDKFEFFKYYQLLQNFCVVDLSSFYFDIVKDRLYTGGKKSTSRLAVQTVLAELLNTLVRVLVPVTPHLAEDIWQHMPEKLRGKEKSVLLTDFPKPNKNFLKPELDEFWKDVIKVRSVVNKALESARAQRKFGSSLESKVFVSLDDKAVESKLNTLKAELPGIFITSQAEIVSDLSKFTGDIVLSQISEEGVSVVVLAADGRKCPRCWKFATDIGQNSSYAELCVPCAEAMVQDK